MNREYNCCGGTGSKKITNEKPDNNDIRQAVRKGYGNIAKKTAAGCGCNKEILSGNLKSVKDYSVTLGYSPNDVSSVPEGSNMGLGCGNPKAIANLVPGETVLDLGSGGGFDCFLAARAVGVKGFVIGIDMTPEMIAKSRENAHIAGIKNVDFRLGEIESLPVENNTIDVIMSNCVINLSPEKQRVFQEAYRVLKPGGRLAISDIVTTSPLPEEVKRDLSLYTGCIAGASQIKDVEAMLKEAGFTDIQIQTREESKTFISDWLPVGNSENSIVSAVIQAVKPKDATV